MLSPSSINLFLNTNLLPQVRFNEVYIPCKKSTTLAAVILFPDDDDPTFDSDDVDLKKRMDYMAREYHVFLKRVSSLEAAINILSDIRLIYDIGHLELGGHGTATSISWPDYTICVNKDADIIKLMMDMLEADAVIMTLSCYNGLGHNNILDYLAKIAKGHRVIGVNCANSKHLSLKVSCARPFKVKYKCGNRNVTVIKQY
jgi:hypothetical protein